MAINPNDHEQHEIDNRADQLNPNNDAYWSSRYDDDGDDVFVAEGWHPDYPW